MRFISSSNGLITAEVKLINSANLKYKLVLSAFYSLQAEAVVYHIANKSLQFTLYTARAKSFRILSASFFLFTTLIITSR
jgi:hypothetical protein